MRIVPIDRPTLITLAAAAGLPLVPVLLFVTPANELIADVSKMLRNRAPGTAETQVVLHRAVLDLRGPR